MSTTTDASLDNDWDFAALKASSVLPSDDELDGFTLSSASSELGDDPWGGIDEDDNESTSLERTESETPVPEEHDHAQRTPLQISRSLSVDAAEEEETATTEMEHSEHSETNSSFSFRFPDPLDASFEYDKHYQSQDMTNGLDDISDIDTESISGTEAEAILNESERSATFVIAPTRSFATPTRTRFYLATALFAVLLGCLLVRPSFLLWNSTSSLEANPPLRDSSSSIPTLDSAQFTQVPARLIAPTQSSTAIPPDSTSKSILSRNIINDPTSHTPLITDTHKPLMLEAPPPSGFFIGSWSTPATDPRAENGKKGSFSGSLSLAPWSRVSTSLSTTFHSFSRIVLKDIQDILFIIDEILRFLGKDIVVDAIQETSQSFMDYLYEKLGDRHERAKRNARALGSRGMELVKWFQQR